MKIRVVPQLYYREYKWQDAAVSVYDDPASGFWKEHNFITIRHSGERNLFSAIPVESENILRLQFDDATEDPEKQLVLFNTNMAQKIKIFVENINRDMVLFVNCAAGVSRSGAVGDVLNEYYNRYIEFNARDDYYFKQYNRQILPNPLVRKLLYDMFFTR